MSDTTTGFINAKNTNDNINDGHTTNTDTKREVFNKLTLVCRNIKEVIGMDELTEKIKRMCLTNNIIGTNETKYDMSENYHAKIRGYWGTAPTRSPSIAYLIPLMKFRDMIDAGIDMTLFIADIHSYLDKGFSWIEKTSERTAYYVFIISVILKSLGVLDDTYHIILGSNLQVDIKYILNLFKFMSRITLKQAQKAGSDVVKQNKDPTIGSLVYPLMQVIDEKALRADVELGGVDQRKIFALSRDYAEVLGYDKCSYLMNEMLPSLSKPGAKMSSSDSISKIEFTDSEKIIDDKIKKAYCIEGDVNDNPCVMLYKLILCPLGYKFTKKQIVYHKKTTYVAPLGKEEYNSCICNENNSTIPKSHDIQQSRSAEEPVIITNIVELNYHEFEEQWKNKDITAQELKKWLSISINQVVDPVRKTISDNQDLYNKAFS